MALVRRSTAFDAAVCAALITLVLLPIRSTEWPILPRLWLGLAMAVALWWRRRHPVPVMAAIGMIALAQVLLTSPTRGPLPYDVAVLVAMYSVVKYGDRMRDAYLAAGVVTIGIAIEVFGTTSPHYWYLLVPWYLGVCGGVWLAGYTVRSRRLYIQGLEDRAATLEREREHLARLAVVEERAAIARELHDIVAHGLAVMIIQAAGGSYAFDRRPERARAALATIASTGREALADMHRLVTVLRTDNPDAGLRRVGLAELDTLIDGAREAGLVVDVDIALPDTLPATVELTVYRIVQEGLTNILRHAGPQARVTLRLAHTDTRVRVTVQDDGGHRDGAGEDGAAGPRTGHAGGVRDGTAVDGGRPDRRDGQRAAPGHGLIGMRERIDMHAGTFRAGPRLDGGWLLTAEIPCAS